MIPLAFLVLGQENAAGLKNAADRLLAAGKYQAASEAFAKAADAFDRKGDPNAGQVLRERSLRWRTQIRFFVRRPASTQGLAKWEPAAGCYIGANIEREEAARTPARFNAKTVPHAIFFRYRGYGVDFPSEEARVLRRMTCGIQIAFEPKSYAEVADDRYLRKFARDARASKIPVFLRLASEMNGRWTVYHRDPAAYRAMFRRVAAVMHRDAPNVAMVWCPNEIPREPIDQYYPGADAVDWVGVNFYSVIYNDADRAREASWRWPTDQVKYVYDRYSARHPIMVGEWAASHRSSVDGIARPEFAITKIQQFYRSIPFLYPRLKAVHWLSYNALKYARSSRQLNNYSLFDNPLVGAAYTFEVNRRSYLSQIQESLPDGWREVRPGLTPVVGEPLAVWFRSYDAAATLEMEAPTGRASSTGPVVMITKVPEGRATFTVRDGKGRVALSQANNFP
jgi:hypothetical protein